MLVERVQPEKFPPPLLRTKRKLTGRVSVRDTDIGHPVD